MKKNFFNFEPANLHMHAYKIQITQILKQADYDWRHQATDV